MVLYSGGFRYDQLIEFVSELILVATGFGETETDHCQIIDVTDTTKVCMEMPSYPSQMYTGTGRIVSDDIIICGGKPIGAKFQSSCYTFNVSSYSWVFLSDMMVERSQMTSAVLNGALWITGGYTSNGGSEDASTELVYPNGTVLPGPTLPSARDDHCMVNLHDDTIMILGSDGGTTDKKNSIVYDPFTDVFSTTSPMLYDRKRAGCALFQSSLHGNRPVVLVVGGEHTNTAELFDYTSSSGWEESMYL